ncbi:hypothetical protein HPB52_008890 [Rhipicephalus sanguineus]|uniref:Endonuclease/exonuclease/phosphatase domain-containing protein n=1 Tax=Rhipicephalus sanguineus TaxID=34632 RepID=A0A9D4PZX5_RHISA|nr:hypothetical protein HPB52_008890 [Rhipicephalus sanguineus]
MASRPLPPTPPKEHCFTFNVPEDTVSIYEIIDSIEETVGDEGVLFLQHLGTSKFLVATRTADQATSLLVNAGFCIRKEKSTVTSQEDFPSLSEALAVRTRTPDATPRLQVLKSTKRAVQHTPPDSMDSDSACEQCSHDAKPETSSSESEVIACESSSNAESVATTSNAVEASSDYPSSQLDSDSTSASTNDKPASPVTTAEDGASALCSGTESARASHAATKATTGKRSGSRVTREEGQAQRSSTRNRSRSRSAQRKLDISLISDSEEDPYTRGFLSLPDEASKELPSSQRRPKPSSSSGNSGENCNVTFKKPRVASQTDGAPPKYILLGDFNCVLDTSRDIRGPGQGGCNYQARELGKIVADWQLLDAWVTLHGDAFAATRASGLHGSRLDRVYVPEVFRAALVTCDVVQVPSYCLNASDHKPLLFTMQVCNGGRSPRSWRMDPTILHDEECIKYMGTEVAASIAEVDVLDPATWDRLKKRWRLISEEAGKERHARITSRMNETLRRMQIVERGGTSTQAMRDYVDAQRKVEGQNPAKSTTADFDGKKRGRQHNDRAVEVRNTFKTQFERLFAQEPQLDDYDFEPRFLPFCDGLPKLKAEDTEGLHSPETKDEVSQALMAMNARSAPGPDGILTAFYVRFFEILGDLLTDVVNNFITEGKKPLSFRDGRVVLLLKEGMDRSNPKSWRPITLLNTDYKLVATLLVLRLRPLLNELASPLQSCAVPGRSAFATLTLIRDLFYYAKAKEFQELL